MKRKTAKRSFVIRIVIACFVIFIAVSLIVTYSFARNYMLKIEKTIDNRLELIVKDINLYKNLDKSSLSQEDNLNVLEAYEIIQYYRNAGMNDVVEEVESLDIGMYYVEKDQKGNDINAYNIIPEGENESPSPSDFRIKCELENLQSLKDGADIYHNSGSLDFNYCLTAASFEDSKTITGTNYVVKIYAQMVPVKYTWVILRNLYICLFLIIIMVGIMLICSHNNTIENRFEIEKKRRYMMDSMAHEMKTPLSIIKGFGELLQEETSKEKKVQFVQNIVNEADIMNDIIISMLDYSKMEAGTYPMELSSLSVSALAKEQIEHARVLIDRKKLDLEVDIHETPMILADEKLVKNIIGNFISNAVSHSSIKGTVRIEIKESCKDIYIGVFNQGSSVNPEEMEKLWDSFYRNRVANDDSSGLGLAIVRNACLMHNGTFGCHNEKDGVVFWAKIKSMEDNIRMQERIMGPVIGVTRPAYRLNGIIVTAIGIMLQEIFIYPQVSSVFAQINMWMNGIEENVIGISSGWWGILAGSILIVYGIYDLFKNESFGIKYLIISYSIAGLTIIVHIFELVMRNSTMAFNTMILIAIWTTLLFVVSVMIINRCINISDLLNSIQIKNKLRYRKILYISLYTVWIIMVALSEFSDAIGSGEYIYYSIVNVGKVIIPCYYTVTLVQCWKWFDGKVKNKSSGDILYD